MEKKDFLQEEIEQILEDINFISRYESISKRYNERNENFKYENNEILQIVKNLGHPMNYSKATEFSLEENLEGFNLRFGFTIRFNSLDFGLSVVNNEMSIRSSAPWGFLIQLISNGNKKVSKAMFKDFKDLEGILKEAFSIYDDLKKGLLEIAG